jgi:hypothetical protein
MRFLVWTTYSHNEMTDPSSTSVPSTSTPVPKREATSEELLAGRLTALALRNLLDTQAATLRSQLAIVETQKAHAESIMERLDARLAKQQPALHRLVTEDS